MLSSNPISSFELTKHYFYSGQVIVEKDRSRAFQPLGEHAVSLYWALFAMSQVTDAFKYELQFKNYVIPLNGLYLCFTHTARLLFWGREDARMEQVLNQECVFVFWLSVIIMCAVGYSFLFSACLVLIVPHKTNMHRKCDSDC